jgi:hypothetical protein
VKSHLSKIESQSKRITALETELETSQENIRKLNLEIETITRTFENEIDTLRTQSAQELDQ